MLQRKGGEGHSRQRESLEGNRTWLAQGRAVRLLPAQLCLVGGRGGGKEGWAAKGTHACSLETVAKGGGEQVVILTLLGFSFCPLSGPLSL